MAQMGILHEVGDLGLGFDPLTPEEQKTVTESQENENKEKDGGN